jgi:GT2 family glycosyltransferase/exopolysaccharide biosynthesis predicted pyruvyltransferase EpsI
VTASARVDPVQLSRQQILDEIGEPPDLTVVRGLGNCGDQLILEGVRALLADRIYREVELTEMCAARGHTMLLSGGGAFCRPFHEVMPRALSVAAHRFERVIVLPSSFDPSEDVVRGVLARTRATVFAREAESYRRIAPLCDARLAHDCAFFFDFTQWRGRGSGTLNAFRTDREARATWNLPVDNDDISATAPTLEHWLETIAAHELVRTDRAHVMIAAALLGKQVEFAPSSYHKLEAIAGFALSDYPVRALAKPAHTQRPERSHRTRASGEPVPRVSAVILSRDRPDLALRAIDSVATSSVASEVIVVDNNSAPPAADRLAVACEQRGIVFRRSERNLGCAGGRKLALQDARGEFVLFLDDDAELAPGALELLLNDLDDHPEAVGVTATVLMGDGTIHHSGGWIETADEVVEFPLIGAGETDPDQLAPTGPAGWVPGTAALIRRASLEEFPIDSGMRAYFEDNEWCYRVAASGGGSFRRSREARAVHHSSHKYGPGLDFTSRSHAVELLHAHAAFYERHGMLLGVGLFELAPELRDLAGHRDLAAARLLMELLLAKGTDWTFMEWMNGGLSGLLSGGRELVAAEQRERELIQQLERLTGRVAEQDRTMAEQQSLLEVLHQRHLTLQRVENGAWFALRRRLQPLARLLAPLLRRGGG